MSDVAVMQVDDVTLDTLRHDKVIGLGHDDSDAETVDSFFPAQVDVLRVSLLQDDEDGDLAVDDAQLVDAWQYGGHAQLNSADLSLDHEAAGKLIPRVGGLAHG